MTSNKERFESILSSRRQGPEILQDFLASLSRADCKTLVNSKINDDQPAVYYLVDQYSKKCNSRVFMDKAFVLLGFGADLQPLLEHVKMVEARNGCDKSTQNALFRLLVCLDGYKPLSGQQAVDPLLLWRITEHFNDAYHRETPFHLNAVTVYPELSVALRANDTGEELKRLFNESLPHEYPSIANAVHSTGAPALYFALTMPCGEYKAHLLINKGASPLPVLAKMAKQEEQGPLPEVHYHLCLLTQIVLERRRPLDPSVTGAVVNYFNAHPYTDEQLRIANTLSGRPTEAAMLAARARLDLTGRSLTA